MKFIAHKKQIIGVAESGSRDAVVTFVCPDWTSRDKAVIDAALKRDGSISLSFLVHAPEVGDHFILSFARPLTFNLDRVKARITQVTQPDLPLRTTADPSTLLADIAFEVLELVRTAATPIYAAHPDYAATCERLRELVSVRKLERPTSDLS